MSELGTMLLGAVCGAAGFLVTKLYVEPILRYRNLKARILSDLIFYEDAIEAKSLNNQMKAKWWARIQSTRRHSTDLRAAYEYLPKPYLQLLKMRKEMPDRAASDLMGLSNTTELREAAQRSLRIRRNLRFDIRKDY